MSTHVLGSTRVLVHGCRDKGLQPLSWLASKALACNKNAKALLSRERWRGLRMMQRDRQVVLVLPRLKPRNKSDILPVLSEGGRSRGEQIFSVLLLTSGDADDPAAASGECE